MTSILWLRRDLRRADHPALAAAHADGEVLPVFVLDPAIYDSAGPVRQAWLARTLRALDHSYDGRLCLRHGKPEHVIAALAKEVGATSVHVSTETEPDGAARDARVRAALANDGVGLDFANNGDIVPKAVVDKVQSYKQQVVDGKLTVPTVGK